MIPEIAGKIMVALNEVTGTKEIRNGEDIPIIFQYAAAYSLTSKEIYEACNSSAAITLFFESMCSRFGESSEYYAPLWDTKGSKKYLVDFLERENYLQVYRKIQTIKQIARVDAKEIFDVETYSKKGIFLQIAETEIRVISPLGTIRITDDTEDEEDVMLAGQLLVEKLNATFVMTLPCSVLGDTTLYNLGTCSFSESSPPFNRKGLKRIWKLLETIDKGGDPLATPFSVRRTRRITPPSFMKKISDFADWAQQTLISVAKKGGRSRKMIMNPLDASIWEKMNEGVASFAKDRECTVFSHYEQNALCLSLRAHFSSAHIPQMAELYKDVIKNLGIGWIPAALSDFPGIFFRKSEETHYLFIKKGSHFNNESALFKLLASQLEVDMWLLCGDKFEECREDSLSYLWIQKDQFEKVKDRMGLLL